MEIVPIVLSGGKGTRLWPLSREQYPKQFLPLVNTQKTLLQETLLRTHKISTAEPYIICNEAYQFIVADQLLEIEKSAKIILEPIGRDTAPAIALASLDVCAQYGDALLVIMPSDHLIDDITNFHSVFDTAFQYAAQEFLITFGISPTRPETGYGYIQVDNTIAKNAYRIQKFAEKPNHETAERYIQEGNYYWNSGIFVFRASSYLAELKQFAPDIYEQCLKAAGKPCQPGTVKKIDMALFEPCRSLSIDYAVMEHTANAMVVPIEFSWSDLGSWHSLWEANSQDVAGNVVQGDVLAEGVTNSFIRSENRLIVALDVHDHIVVETSDAILVASKQAAHKVKDIVEKLKLDKREEAHTHRKVYRPWGSYEVLLEAGNFKVKHLFIKPGQNLSLQMHKHRSEHWVIVEGVAEVTCDDSLFILKQGESTFIPAKSKHRLKNLGYTSLEIIEVQCGSYLGEDDIIRFSDDYGRTTQVEESIEDV